MNVTIQALSVLLPSGYLLLAMLYLPAFESSLGAGRTRRFLTLGVLGLHLLLFGLHWRAIGHFPVIDRWGVLSAEALTLVLLFAWIRWTVHHTGTASIVFAAAFALQLFASAFGKLPLAPRVEPAGPLVVVHVGTSLLAGATLVLSGLHGALYLLLFRQMRAKRFGAITRTLPDLALLAKMTRGAALAGFVLLGIGLNAGIAWAHVSGVENFSYSDPFVLMMLAIWLHFGLVALSGRIPGLTARRASFAATAGFVVLIASALISVLPELSFHPS